MQNEPGGQQASVIDEERIFHQAIAIEDPAAQEAFICEQCSGNQRLLNSVRKLISHHSAAGRFLEDPPAELLQTLALRAGDTVAEDSRPSLHWFLLPSEYPGGLGRLGHYEIIEVIGTGGMGTVLRAHDPKLHREVAIKLLASANQQDAAAQARLVREARAAAAINHQHVVTIHAIHDEGPVPFIVMEFVEGECLQQFIDRQGVLAPELAVNIACQIAAGLEAAHQRGLVHRDVKPANILLEAGTCNVKITDFGLARGANNATVTEEGRIAGTPQFMSPEQALCRPFDHRSDLFSLGGVLYAMCAGRPPFVAETALGALRAIADDAPLPVSQVNPKIPEPLQQAISCLLEKDPQNRPQSAAAAAAMLQRALAPALRGEPARAAPRDEPPPRLWPRRGLAYFGAAALALAAIVVMIKDRNGASTRIELPRGAQLKLSEDGTVEVNLAGDDMAASSVRAAGSKAQEEKSRFASRKSAAAKRDLSAEARQWHRQVASLEPAAQVKAVAARLRQLNPGFDGLVEPTIEGNAVTGLAVPADQLTDLAPLAALDQLRVLKCSGSSFEAPAPLANLEPLAGLSLKELSCGRTSVADLAPLSGMAIEVLDCSDTRVRSLEPIRGMPIRDLSIQHTPVEDLGPLAGMPLRSLNCSDTGVREFTVLAGMPLIALYFDKTDVRDLSALSGLPLQILNWREYDYLRAEHRQIVQSIKTLEVINSRPAADFWRSVEPLQE
jgi:hypothetical protein